MRHIRFGEGGYADTEKLIRELLLQANPDAQLAPATELADDTPDAAATTPETYLGSTKKVNYAGEQAYRTGDFSFPDAVPADSFALDGRGRSAPSRSTPERRRRPHPPRVPRECEEVRMVLSGDGTVVVDDGDTKRRIDVTGTPTSYRLLDVDTETTGTITVTVSPGVEAYSFTFG